MFKGISDSEPGEDVVHVEQWHLDIDTSQLRWESYIKAGYYVSCFQTVMSLWVLM